MVSKSRAGDRVHEKGFITFAFGAKRYIDMAAAMAASAELRGSQTKFAVVCDKDHEILRKYFDIIIPIDKGLGRGVCQKLYIDKYSPFKDTIFIDSDCLFFKNPDMLWPLLADPQGFGVESYDRKQHGDKYYSMTDVDAFLDFFGEKMFPVFNSGLFYFNRSDKAAAVFEKARYIYSVRDGLPLKEFKDAPVNDEPIYQMAVQLCGIKTLPWRDTMAMILEDINGLNRIDVIRGNGAHFRGNNRVDPVLIHFNIHTQDLYPYLREIRRLSGRSLFFSVFTARTLSLWRKLCYYIKHYFLLKILFFFWGTYRKIFPKKRIK